MLQPPARDQVRRTVIMLLLLGGAASALAKDDLAKPSTAVEGLIERALDAKHPYELKRCFETVLRTAGPDGVRALKTNKHVGVAIRAAWEDSTLAMSSEGLQRFVGFVEGRLGVNVPPAWQESILHARAQKGKYLWFPDTHEKYVKTDSGIRAPEGTRVQKKVDELCIEVNGEAVTIPAQMLKEVRPKLGLSLVPLFSGRFAYLALYSGDGPIPFVLIAVHRESGVTAWKSNVWGGGGLTDPSGIGHHAVGLLLDGDRILVFGAGNNAVYVEGFRLKDGAVLFRFSTSY